VKNRFYVEDMYEHRHQKEFGSILGLAWRLLRGERGGFAVVGYYGLMHLTGFADRKGMGRLADMLRRLIPLPRIERGITGLLGGKFRFVITEAGGCAVDIDNEGDYDIAEERYEEWRKTQLERAERIYGPLPLPAVTAGNGRDSGDAD
jgi:hypothetical protein